MPKKTKREGQPPSRKPEPAEQVAARMRRYRERKKQSDRAFLLSQGYDARKLGEFVTAWKKGRIKVTFEIVKEGNDG